MTVTVREATPSDYPVIFDLIRNELGYQSVDKVKFLQRMVLMETDANYVKSYDVKGISDIPKYIIAVAAHLWRMDIAVMRMEVKNPL